jgi:hypothetical protein
MNRVSLALAGIIIALLAAAWTFWPREKVQVGVSAPLPPAKEAKGEPKTPIHPKAVNAYPDKVKAKLSLPDAVVKDPAQKLIGTGRLDAEDRAYTLSTTLDTQTGEAQLYARPDPLPWIGPGKRGAVGIAYGAGDVGIRTKAYAYHDLLQAKALHAGVRAEIDQRGGWWGGAYVEYRF